MAQQYDPTDVYTIIDGEVITKFAEDSMIEAEPLEDKVELVKGAQGEGTFTINANDGGQITLSLAADSPALPKLNKLYKESSQFPIDIQHRGDQINESAGGSDAMIQSMGPMNRGSELSDREIVILVDDFDNTIA